MTGQSLINAAIMRNIPTEISNYRSAVFLFKHKYFALPGDMANATDFWDAAVGDGTGSACYEFISTDKKTCNGNGDGIIGYGWSNRHEVLRAWQHLSNAGLIAAQYSGSSGTPVYNDAIIGNTVPASKLDTAGYGFIYSDPVPSNHIDFYPSFSGNMLSFGANAGGQWNNGAILSTADGYYIDKKIDDSKPGTGFILTHKGDESGMNSWCATNGDPATAEYRLQVNDPEQKRCNFYILFK